MLDLKEFSEAIDGALMNGSPCILATVDAQGRPNLGFKGSMMVLDSEHLAYWERSRGQHLANLRVQPQVAVQYFNRDQGLYLHFHGEAELHETGPVREQVLARVIQPELDRDPERRGVAVVIRVHTVADVFKQRRLTRSA